MRQQQPPPRPPAPPPPIALGPAPQEQQPLGPPRKLDTSLFLAIFALICNLFIPFLEWNRVTVPWQVSACAYFFLISTAGWAAWKWEVSARWSILRRIGFTSFLLVVLVAVAVWGTVTQYRREHPKIVSPKGQPVQSPQGELQPKAETVKPSPIIRLNFDPVGDDLPISIAPRGEISVIYIDEDSNPVLFHHRNINYKDALLWPNNPPPPHLPIAVLRASDVGESDAFDVTIRLMFMVGGDNLPGGLKTTQIDLLPTIDLLSGGKDLHAFYVVNKSLTVPAAIWFPDTATARMQGEQQIKPVPITTTGMVMKMIYTDPKTGEKFSGPAAVTPGTYKWPK